MTQENSKTVSEINGMGNRSIGETVLPPTQTSNSGVVGEPSAAPASPPRKALRGVLERRWRRKNDINSLHGLIREHSRVIAAMHSGRIPLEKGEVLSRAYARHREMVSAYEQQSQLAAIQAQLEALRSDRGLLPIDTPPLPGDGEVKS
jgi:hypothetical protein